MITLNRVEAVLDATYACAVDPGGWPSLLGSLSALFRSHFADLFARTEDYTAYRGVVFGLDRRDYEEELLGGWARRNVWGSRFPVRVAGEVVSTRQMVAKEELVRSAMYNEYLAPRGLHEGLRLSLWAGEGWIQDISLLRPWSAGPFAGQDVLLAGRLLPHLRRAASVARRLGSATFVGHAALDALPHAAFLLGAKGRIEYANSAALTLLRDPDGCLLLQADGVLHAPGPEEPSFAAALGWGLGAKLGRQRSAELRLPPRSGHGPAWTASLTPLRPEIADWAVPSAPALLVLVSRPPEPALPAAGDLVARFGLTEAEAQV